MASRRNRSSPSDSGLGLPGLAGKLVRDSKPKPYFVTLPLGHVTTPEVERWNRFYTAHPGLLIPHRNDSATGTADLRFISIRYAQSTPLTQQAGYSEADTDVSTTMIYRGLPSGPAGACYLHEPGDWWVYISCGQAIPASSTFLQFVFFPHIWEGISTPFELARTTAHFPTSAGQVITPATSGKLISVQELLQAVKGVEIGVSVAGNNTRYRWVDPPAGNSYIAFQVSPWRFEGQFLPLADLWILNNTGANITAHRTYYF